MLRSGQLFHTGAELPVASPGRVLPCLLVVAPAIYAGAMHEIAPDLYYAMVQEDRWVEWASFWAFLLAGAIGLVGARYQYRTFERLPWWFTGLAVFCLLVAMEEISWAQRLVGYRPPVLFLEDNFQQELNLHNLLDADLRKLALQGVILGYGVLLPCLELISVMRRWLRGAGIAGAPLRLVPAFLVMFAVYVTYPWQFSGEWVELMLGLAMLVAMTVRATEARHPTHPQRQGSHPIAVAGGAVLIAATLGWASASASHHLYDGSPETLQSAQREITALTTDFRSGRIRTRCGLHKRLFTFVEEYRQHYLREGAFAHLGEPRLAEARARFFLDPWNSPYWIRHKCSGNRGRRSLFIYSLGPNRSRDSTPWEIRGDDLGAYL